LGVAKEENAKTPRRFINGHGRGGKMNYNQNQQWRKANKAKCGNE
jgi:hypothetical protein